MGVSNPAYVRVVYLDKPEMGVYTYEDRTIGAALRTGDTVQVDRRGSLVGAIVVGQGDPASRYASFRIKPVAGVLHYANGIPKQSLAAATKEDAFNRIATLESQVAELYQRLYQRDQAWERVTRAFRG